MKIEEVQDAVLSNAEVIKHVNDEWFRRERREKESQSKSKDLSASGKKKSGERQKSKHDDQPALNYSHLRINLSKYFHDAKTASALPAYGTYPKGAVRKLLQELKKFGLTKAELVMILNLKPQDTVVLDVIVEELDTRIPESDAQEDMLAIINQILGGDCDEKRAARVEMQHPDGMDVDEEGGVEKPAINE